MDAVTVTMSEVVTVTVLPSSSIDVDAAVVSESVVYETVVAATAVVTETAATPAASSTPVAAVVTSSTGAAPVPTTHTVPYKWHGGYSRNATFWDKKKYAVPSGFTKLPKYW